MQFIFSACLFVRALEFDLVSSLFAVVHVNHGLGYLEIVLKFCSLASRFNLLSFSCIYRIVRFNHAYFTQR